MRPARPPRPPAARLLRRSHPEHPTPGRGPVLVLLFVTGLSLLPVAGPMVGVLGAAPAEAPARASEDPDSTRALPLKIVPAGVEEVHLVPAGPTTTEASPTDGAAAYLYRVEYRDGRVETLSPDAFAELLYTEFYGRNRLFAVLNITSTVGIAWVGLGLLGQILFTGRMLVQWLASERNRRSVVPVAFWWMSLGGATMLIVYFVWRKDIVGVLGQATGWMIYLRNLRLIYRSPRPAATAQARVDDGDGGAGAA